MEEKTVFLELMGDENTVKVLDCLIDNLAFGQTIESIATLTRLYSESVQRVIERISTELQNDDLWFIMPTVDHHTGIFEYRLNTEHPTARLLIEFGRELTRSAAPK